MDDQVSLSPTQLEDLRAFLKAEWKKLESIEKVLFEAWQSAMTPTELADGLSLALDGEAGLAEPITRLLVSLKLLSIQTESSASDIVVAIASGLRSSDFAEAELVRWNSDRSILESLLASKALRRVAMSVNLSYEYSHLLKSARIITDVRPIFDEEVSIVEAAVVSHTIRLNFDSIDGDHSLIMALDDSDIKRLMLQCERALRKSEVAAKAVNKGLGIPTFISGQSRNLESPEEQIP